MRPHSGWSRDAVSDPRRCRGRTGVGELRPRRRPRSGPRRRWGSLTGLEDEAAEEGQARRAARSACGAARGRARATAPPMRTALPRRGGAPSCAMSSVAELKAPSVVVAGAGRGSSGTSNEGITPCGSAAATRRPARSQPTRARLGPAPEEGARPGRSRRAGPARGSPWAPRRPATTTRAEQEGARPSACRRPPRGARVGPGTTGAGGVAHGELDFHGGQGDSGPRAARD